MTTRAERRIVAKGVQKALAAHPCGDCTACCGVLAVAEIGKAEGAPCPNLVAPQPEASVRGGCAIYKDRPGSCSGYNCVWRVGLLDELLPGPEGRPSQLGILFDANDTHATGILLLVAREVRPGAIETAMPLLHELAAQGHVLYLIDGDRRRMMGPEERVNQVREAARRNLPLLMR